MHLRPSGLAKSSLMQGRAANGMELSLIWHQQQAPNNLGLPVQMFTLGSLMLGNASIEPILSIANVVAGLSIVLFGYNVLKNLKGYLQQLVCLSQRTLR